MHIPLLRGRTCTCSFLLERARPRLTPWPIPNERCTGASLASRGACVSIDERERFGASLAPLAHEKRRISRARELMRAKLAREVFSLCSHKMRLRFSRSRYARLFSRVALLISRARDSALEKGVFRHTQEALTLEKGVY